MDEEYEANKTAKDIVKALLSGEIYPTDIDKHTYDTVYSQLLVRYPGLRPSIFSSEARQLCNFQAFLLLHWW